MGANSNDPQAISEVSPFWRAVVGGVFGAIIGGVWLFKGFLGALLMLGFIIIGVIVGTMTADPNE